MVTTDVITAPTYRNVFVYLFLTFGLIWQSVSLVETVRPRTTDSNFDKTEIEMILTRQTKCWNNKDIEGFMATYWRSEDLTFSSGGKTTRGWQATLDRYKAKYPPEKMGRLSFDNLETTMLGKKAALVLGQWHLNFNEQNLDGNFSLVLRKIDGNWKIIHDHSSSFDK